MVCVYLVILVVVWLCGVFRYCFSVLLMGLVVYVVKGSSVVVSDNVVMRLCRLGWIRWCVLFGR